MSAAARVSVVSSHVKGCCRMLCGQGVAWSRINTDPAAVATAKPIKVLITGAAGQIAYSLVFLISRGIMFGPYQPVIIHLLDVPQAMNALGGVAMEITDCAFPLVKGVLVTSKVEEAFAGINVALFIGSMPRKPGMERKDLIGKNASIFRAQGAALAQYADRDVKVLVVGNPANTNAIVLLNSAMGVPKKNITCMTRLDHNRTKAQVAVRLGVPVTAVHNVIIWGNHSTTQFPDVRHGHVVNFPRNGLTTPLRSVINNDTWLAEAFVPLIQKRGQAVMEARKLSSAASASTAVCDHVRDWLLGTPKGEIVSMGVLSDGNPYSVPEGLIFSMPVVCEGGEYHVVSGLGIDSYSRTMLDKSATELIEERDTAFSLVGLTKRS
ncbi:malate dehydrogenase, mitochondrial [Pelomyxa schiedti]|nr:malate dehydrogenase, mitochondrial [Pelomyxa schiedti]